jgi:hypothetical protein
MNSALCKVVTHQILARPAWGNGAYPLRSWYLAKGKLIAAIDLILECTYHFRRWTRRLKLKGKLFPITA